MVTADQRTMRAPITTCAYWSRRNICKQTEYQSSIRDAVSGGWPGPKRSQGRGESARTKPRSSGCYGLHRLERLYQRTSRGSGRERANLQNEATIIGVKTMMPIGGIVAAGGSATRIARMSKRNERSHDYPGEDEYADRRSHSSGSSARRIARMDETNEATMIRVEAIMPIGRIVAPGGSTRWIARMGRTHERSHDDRGCSDHAERWNRSTGALRRGSGESINRRPAPHRACSRKCNAGRGGQDGRDVWAIHRGEELASTGILARSAPATHLALTRIGLTRRLLKRSTPWGKRHRESTHLAERHHWGQCLHGATRRTWHGCRRIAPDVGPRRTSGRQPIPGTFVPPDRGPQTVGSGPASSLGCPLWDPSNL